MLTQVELNALADYLLETVDCHPDYEDDCFGISFEGHRFYVERQIDCFRVELGSEVLELPRI